jgi:predicted dithiol-disulfide oxidoreductase (DUF899 family)
MLYTRLSTESKEYRQRREELRLAEIQLIEERERVAALRRALPPGPPVEDYVFLEGPSDLAAGDDPVSEVCLSDLFVLPDRPLVIYHLMYGKAQTEPCPMCTMWVDGWNGVAHHLAQNLNFAIVAAADPPAFRAHARDRGWHRLRLLSCGDNTYGHDLDSESESGEQGSQISVFVRDPDGVIRHTYSNRPAISPEIQERGIDALCATWNVLDLTPEGRGDWYASLSYGA